MAVNQNEDTSICNSPAKGSSSADLLKRLNGVLSEKTTNPKRVRPFGPSTTGLCPLPWPIAMLTTNMALLAFLWFLVFVLLFVLLLVSRIIWEQARVTSNLEQRRARRRAVRGMLRTMGLE
ncbi:hypothetical protein SLS57_011670 [Botryosphaeria dothidea]